jgi:amino acid transporter
MFGPRLFRKETVVGERSERTLIDQKGSLPCDLSGKWLFSCWVTCRCGSAHGLRRVLVQTSSALPHSASATRIFDVINMDKHSPNESTTYEPGSLSLLGAVSMGTGVMIGAGIFALTGQMAEQAGNLFPLAFLSAAVVTAFSAYSYIKISNAHPSAGGIAMYLKKAYGEGTVTASFALLMYFSMVINESLVARTFGTYTLQLFDVDDNSWLVPVLGVGVLIVAFIVNVLGNQVISRLSIVTAVIKILGILIFAAIGLWLAGVPESGMISTTQASGGGFLAATALGILAFKGFTTITNSGGELKEPKKNVSRAIIVSLIICLIVYLLVAFAVAGSLSIEKIVQNITGFIGRQRTRSFLNHGHSLLAARGVACKTTTRNVARGCDLCLFQRY